MDSAYKTACVIVAMVVKGHVDIDLARCTLESRIGHLRVDAKNRIVKAFEYLTANATVAGVDTQTCVYTPTIVVANPKTKKGKSCLTIDSDQARSIVMSIISC